MLRPERMSKVSVTGSTGVMSDVIETMHELELLDITEYDGSWEGFEPGDSLAGADEISSTLVTVRALQSTLGIERTRTTGDVDLTDPEDRLERLRTEVTELDDRRDELRERKRTLRDRIDRLETFADLGLPLGLLWGYESLTVLVGEGSATEIETALSEAGVGPVGIESGDETGAIAVFVRADEQSVRDALVGVPFTEYEIPEKTDDPADQIGALRDERDQIDAELERIDSELEALRADARDFLIAYENELRIEAEKREAPLSFATTDRSFIVEGWIPSDRFDAFTDALRDRLGQRVDVAEIKRAAYTPGGHGSPITETESSDAAADADGDAEDVATDGGSQVVTVGDDPPVVQRNPSIASPFEVLVKAVNRPKYTEFDPTLIVFLTLPFIFGFMISDLGYGLVYVLIGYWMRKRFESDTIVNLGAVIVWMGAFTIGFGVFYGELFGLKLVEWLGFEPVLTKGLTTTEWAIAWLLFAVIAGWLQLTIGYIFEFVEEYQFHGLKAAVVEVGSWLLIINGIWVWVFSQHLAESKPTFTDQEFGLVGPDAIFNGNPIPLGFEGFPELAGVVAIGAVALGIVLILSGPWFEVVEVVAPFTHVLSYTRVTAVLLSKGGMAVAANLLYFGAYRDDGFKFIHSSRPDEIDGEVVFGGLSNMGTELSVATFEFGLEGAILGLPVLILGHLIVLAVGGTAAIQAIRLEYFEFFEKFYDGGGRTYNPFGR